MIRTSNVEYIDLWREGRLDVDFAVSSELETAHAVSRSIGMPAARQTDVFADGQVQIVEFEVPEGADPRRRPAAARGALPEDSRVFGIIRGDTLTLPAGGETDPSRRPHRRDRLAHRRARVGPLLAPARRPSRTSSSSAAARWGPRSRDCSPRRGSACG